MCRKFVCTFPCAHIGVQLIFAFNCHIFERVTNLLVNVRADQVLCIRRLSSHCQSNLSHVRIHSVVLCISLSLPEVVRAISYKKVMLIKSLLDQFCELSGSQRTISWNRERSRYYVEILYTSVSRLCPRRQFVSWNFWLRFVQLILLNWIKLVDY